MIHKKLILFYCFSHTVGHWLSLLLSLSLKKENTINKTLGKWWPTIQADKKKTINSFQNVIQVLKGHISEKVMFTSYGVSLNLLRFI